MLITQNLSLFVYLTKFNTTKYKHTRAEHVISWKSKGVMIR